MPKLCNVHDSLCDVQKFFFGLSVLLDQDPCALSDDEFNSWLGCLYVIRDLLEQSLNDLKLELNKAENSDSDS